MAVKAKAAARMASTDWESPICEFGSFATIKDNDNIYQVKIDLSAFEPTFSPQDVNVAIYNNDIQISASRENPNDPNFPRILHRQYRMPDDVDLKSIRINRQSEAITLDAKKEDGISDDVDLKTIQPEIAKKVEVNKPVGDAKPKRKTTGLLSSDMLAKFNCA